MSVDISNHPCFNDKVRHKTARIHLPVAPRCNVQCNFCDRSFDCVNESRPGVTSSVLSPEQALAYLKKRMDFTPNIAVVGIAGPGDPFANPVETMETLRLVRAEYPDMLLCVATNGLNLMPYIEELARLRTSHVTITINAVDPEIGEKVYSWYRYDKRTHNGAEGALELLTNQMKAITALKEHGILVKINTIIIPGINDDHIPMIAKKVSELGADILNCIPMYQNPQTAFGSIEPPTPASVHAIRTAAQKYMPQMHHCTRCRADAVGLLGEEVSTEVMDEIKEFSKMEVKSGPDAQYTNRPYVAVASMEGYLVNQHLGEADQLHIFAYKEGLVQPVETRNTPDTGAGLQRWVQMGEMLMDCHTILVSGVGNNPREVLEGMDVRVLEVEGLIHEILPQVFAGRDLSHLKKRNPTKCGVGCSGGGGGCG